jgi:DNA helicase HerA-like ATPase
VGRGRPVFLQEEDRRRHTFLLGATGTGKSTFLHHLVLQDLAAGAGLCLLDPHGDLHEAVLHGVDGRHRDLVVIEVGDGGGAPGINVLEVEGDGRERSRTATFVSNEMIAILDCLYDLRDTGGPMFETYMRNSLLLAMENRIPGSTLLDIPLLFEDAGFRERLLENCTNPYIVSFWRQQAERAGGDASLRNIAPYVTSKLNQFTHNALLRPIVGQARSTVDFRACMDEGKVVLVNLAKGLLGETSSRLLGMLVLGKLFAAAVGRSRIPAADRRPFHLFIDEAHAFSTSTAAHMMAEARKFGLHLTLATQTLAPVGEGRSQELGEALLGNAGTLLLFRLGAPDAGKMERYTAPELKARDLEDLPNFHVAARLLVDGRPTRPFVFRTPSPPPSPSPERVGDRRKRLLEVRRAHTRSVDEVEEAILRRREELSG